MPVFINGQRYRAFKQLQKPLHFESIDFVGRDPDGRRLGYLHDEIPTRDFVFMKNPLNGKQEQCELVYAVSSTVSVDMGKEIPVEGSLTMFYGLLKVEMHEPDKAFYLRNCNLNRSNDNRMKDIKPVFYEVNIEREKEDSYTDRIIRYQAIAALEKMHDIKLGEIAKTVKFNPEQSRKALMTDFMEKIESSTKFANEIKGLVDSPITRIKSLLYDAQKNQLLRYDQSSKRWYVSSTKETIVRVPTGKDPEELLAQYYLDNEFELEQLNRMLYTDIPVENTNDEKSNEDDGIDDERQDELGNQKAKEKDKKEEDAVQQSAGDKKNNKGKKIPGVDD